MMNKTYAKDVELLAEKANEANSGGEKGACVAVYGNATRAKCRQMTRDACDDLDRKLRSRGDNSFAQFLGERVPC